MLLVYYNPSTNTVEARFITIEDIGFTDRPMILAWYVRTVAGNFMRIDALTILVHV